MTQKTPASPEALARGYKNARGNLLLVVIFTVVNAFMAFMGSFILFSFLGLSALLFGHIRACAHRADGCRSGISAG